MSYERQKRGGSDYRVNLGQDEELDTWARRLGTKKGQVKAAVTSAGDESDEDETYLKLRSSTRGWDKQHASRRG